MPNQPTHKRLLDRAIDHAYGAAESLRIIEENYPDSPILQTFHFGMLTRAVQDIIDLEEKAENAK